ncbi:hypothetical protein SEA_KEELAN_48 [Gordonia phage Keelan]|nr:hypothetical protein SEA_KEELAN_48 [Gordonia phage Keelan]
MTEFDNDLESYFTISALELLNQDRAVAEFRTDTSVQPYKFILHDELFFMYTPEQPDPDMRWSMHTYNNLPRIFMGEYSLPEWTPYGKKILFGDNPHAAWEHAPGTDRWDRVKDLTLLYSDNPPDSFMYVFKVNPSLALGWSGKGVEDGFAGNYSVLVGDELSKHIEGILDRGYWYRMGHERVLA